MRRFDKLDFSEVERCIEKYLKSARDRCGGQKQRTVAKPAKRSVFLDSDDDDDHDTIKRLHIASSSSLMN